MPPIYSTSVQLCIQGLGDAACSSAGVLILVLQHKRSQTFARLAIMLNSGTKQQP
jgi:hypothetical protein